MNEAPTVPILVDSGAITPACNTIQRNTITRFTSSNNIDGALEHALGHRESDLYKRRRSGGNGYEARILKQENTLIEDKDGDGENETGTERDLNKKNNKKTSRHASVCRVSSHDAA